MEEQSEKIMAEALLGALLIAPAVTVSAEAPQSGNLPAEAVQEQEEMLDGCLAGGSLAAGELPEDEGDDGTGIMPCGDFEKEEDVVYLSSQG